MIMAVNTWAVSVLRYGAGVINWTKAELESIDRKTRKQMAIYGMLHPRADVQRLYLPRGQRDRGLCLRTVLDSKRQDWQTMSNPLRVLLWLQSRRKGYHSKKYTGPETIERAEKIRASRGLEEQTFAWPVSAPNRGD